MNNSTLTIIAGPCSVSENSHEQLLDIAHVTFPDTTGVKQSAIWGVRVVGLKSRTALDPTGNGMGIDFPVYLRNLTRFMEGQGTETFEIPPSVRMGEEIIAKTGLTVATEIVDPMIQLPPYEQAIFENKLLVWNPAVNQLGHPTFTMGRYAVKNNWYHGIKNGKWLGDVPASGMSSMEKCWAGLVSYAIGGDPDAHKDKVVMIHRGVDVAGKENFRNLPVHDAAERVKANVSVKLFFDPSHSFGPLLRDRIVDETVQALKLKTQTGTYLYDGLLIEVGDSITDTGQHITISELADLCQKISEFRTIQSPLRP